MARLALRALTLLVGFTAAYVPFVTGWLLWRRARPLEVEGGIATPGALSSFPSGHVVQAVVAFGILAYLWASTTRSRGEALLAWLIAVAGVAAVVIARLRLGAHWPTDILAGSVLGAAWLAVLVLALRRAEAGRAESTTAGTRGLAALRRGALTPDGPFARSSQRPSTPPPNCGGGVVNRDASADPEASNINLPQSLREVGEVYEPGGGALRTLQSSAEARSNSPLSVRNERGGAGGGAPARRSSIPSHPTHSANPSATPPFRHPAQPLWQDLKGTPPASAARRTASLPALDSAAPEAILPPSLALAL